MDFNPQALLGYSPATLYLKLPGQNAGGYERTLNVYRKASGKYEMYYLDAAAYAQLAAGLGYTPHNSTTYSLEDVYRAAQVLGATLNEKMYQDERLLRLYERQMQAYLQLMPAAHEARIAWDRFEQQADRLLMQLTGFLPKHKVKTVTNPRNARAIAYRRDGVFLWPDWRSDTYVNLVASVPFSVHDDVRETVTQWLRQEGLSLTLNNRF